MLRTFKSVLIGVLVLVISISKFGCINNDTPSPNDCTAIDPEEANSKISFTTNSNTVSSTLGGEPGIVYVPAQVAMQGQRTLFDFLTIGGEVSEVRFGIKGATTHYTFEMDTLPDDGNFFLFVDIMGDMPVGCVDVFTQLNPSAGVGSISQFTLDIRPRGGVNTSAFAGKRWRRIYSYDPAEEERIYTDSLYVQLNTTSGLCVEDITTEYRYRIDDYTVELGADASFQLNESYYFRNLDFNASTCDNLVYEERSETFRLEGSWGFNDANSTLTAVYLYGLWDPYFPGTEHRIYEVSFEDNMMVLSLIEYVGLRVPSNERVFEFFEAL